jgi:hypothetical protein
MAAVDLFESFVGQLGEKQRDELKVVLATCREDLQAARSEEARLRIVNNCMAIVHGRRTRSKRTAAA